MANGELLKRTKLEIAKHGNLNRLSIAIGVNPGVIYRVLRGGNSPTLRRLWGIPKHPPRPRLIVEIDPARFDNQRAAHGMSRAEYVVYLMALDKLPY
jgi:hypothetical protein